MSFVDVLLVFADPVIFPSAQPYGLYIIQDTLSTRGLRSEIILPFYHQNPAACLQDALRLYCPKVVGISFRNLDGAGFHYTTDGSANFLGRLKDLLSPRDAISGTLVMGGSGFSIAPDRILDITGADAGFVGPSENDFAEFCVRLIRHDMSVADAAAGLGSAVLPGNAAPKPKASVLGTVTRLDPKAVEMARMVGGTVPLRTKSGCSLRCSYCVVPFIEPMNLRPWEQIRDELRLWVSAGLGDRIFIADGEFNLPSVERAIDLCKRFASEFGREIAWRCYLEAGFVSEALVAALKEANCIGISLTVDSFSDLPRKGFRKGTPAAKAEEAVRLCLSSGIQTGVNLLFGGPGETIETAVSCAQIAKDWNDAGASIALTIGLRVYPGTPLEEISKSAQHAPYYEEGAKTSWLGIFCSPCSRPELAGHVVPILPPSPTIQYTDTIQPEEMKFYRSLAVATMKLSDGDTSSARELFQQLIEEFPARAEPRLGVLKCDYQELHSHSISGTPP